MCSRAFQFMLDQLGVHSWSVQATQTGIGREPAGGPGLTVSSGPRRNQPSFLLISLKHKCMVCPTKTVNKYLPRLLHGTHRNSL